MMLKFEKGPKAEDLAKEQAGEEGLFYGWSVFGGDWYVGTEEQLAKIGVFEMREGKSHET